MHRAFEITVTPAATDALIRDLEKLDFSISLSVHRAASIKPPGDPWKPVALATAADATR